jgi:cytochrome c-type biogenesis protein CcmH/NrfG
MSQTRSTSAASNWTDTQAYTLIVICLLVGIAGGWFLRGSRSPAVAATAQSASLASGMPSSATDQPPTAEQMKRMGDMQAAPLLEQLKSDPRNPDLLAKIGNIYYDTQQYQPAIDYYRQALSLQPGNASLRTDLATAIWYTGDADTAIAEFNKALSYEPNKSNTLFNLGVVKWQGKMDINGAVAAWQKLLDTNPNYENKDKVLELMAQAKKHTGVKPGSAAKPLPQ